MFERDRALLARAMVLLHSLHLAARAWYDAKIVVGARNLGLLHATAKRCD
jgi:hypothetical protein